jgi:Flp pilus assembly protein TadD
MRKIFIVVLMLVVLGLGIGFFLIPTKDEVAIMQQRDQVVVDLGNVDVEAEYQQGRRTFPIISALADKRVAEGNRPAAIALLEQYVQSNPLDVHGRKKLAEQYMLAGDQVKYNAELEAIAAAEPTEQNLKVLADIYNAAQNYEKQIETLKKLVEVTKRQKPEYMADLATILVVVDKRPEALGVVQEIKQLHPNFRSYAIARIETTALAGNGQGEQAYEIAENWIASSIPAPNTKELADLTNILHYGGFAELAIKLVEPRLQLLTTDADLVEAYVKANITAGRSDYAFQILTQIYDAGTMAPQLYHPYLDLALKREDKATADKIAANLKPEIFTEEQALDLIAVARRNNASDTADKLMSAYNVPDYLERKPVLTAVIAMGQGAKDQDEKINLALEADLTSSLRVRLAEACYTAEKAFCVDAVLARFPAIEQMTRPQVEELVNLHIAVKRAPEIVDKVTGQIAMGRVDLTDAQVRAASASGRKEIVVPWLTQYGNEVSVNTLKQLYYIAADNEQPDTAGVLAIKLYERDPTPMNREILVSALIRAEEYEQALPLVRENIGKTAGASDQYITVLSQLAKQKPEYRKELTDHAYAVLQTTKDNRAQISAAYVLLNNGERGKAMPYIKQYASERKGEWAVMWRQLNARSYAGRGGRGGAWRGGRAVAAPVKLTAEQKIKIAMNPQTSEKTKRQMAFDLLSAGRRDDAAAIFLSIANTRPPEDQNVKDLLFLWGPKLNKDQVGWLVARAKAAKTPAEQEKWSDYINVYADDAAVVQYVSSTPDALYNAKLRQKYFRALAAYGSREVYEAKMRGWIAGTTEVDALRDYVTIAQAYGYREAAANGLKRIEQLQPNDPKTLADLTGYYFGKGNYTMAEQYLHRAFKADAGKPTAANADSLYFYQAVLLRRKGDTEGAQASFRRVLELTRDEANLASDARSRRYTAMFHVGEHTKGKQGFKRLLAQYPDDKGVLADFMSALIEYDYLDEATAIANQYDKNSPYYGQQNTLRLKSSQISGVETISHGREMKISFAHPLNGKAPSVQMPKKSGWLEGTKTGYDNMVVSAKHGYMLRFVPTAEDTVQVVPVRQIAQAEITPMEELQREQDLRLQLLYAQIEQKAGAPEAARARVNTLKQHYPQNPQLLTYSANLESNTGNNAAALDLLRQAQTYSPDNEDIPVLLKNARRASNVNFVKADYEYRSFGKNNENIGTLSAAVQVAPRVEMGFTGKYNDMSLKSVRRGGDGLIGDYNTTREQAEIYAAYLGESGSRTQASLFANNDTPGAGIYYDFNNAIGRSGLLAEYHRPYWDFPEAVFLHTVRDKVGVRHTARLTPTLSMGMESSLNNYSVETEDNVVQSGLIRLTLVQQLRASQPYLGIGYGFDGEYLLSKPDRSRTTGPFSEEYSTLPFRGREIHFLSGIIQHDLTPTTHVHVVAGYAQDRLGDGGPQVEGRLTQDITDEVEAGIRARHGIVNSSNDNGDDGSENATHFGAHVMYKF